MKDKDDDIEIDRSDLDDSVVAEEHAQESVSKLKGKLKDAEAKAKEYLDGWQRSQADFVNIRKRDEEAKKEFIKFVGEKLISELIPVLDSLHLSGSHGVVIYKQLMQILKQNGLEEMNPVGETFDPKLHEAIGVIETEKKEDDHKILEVVQKGYILFGRIIRPSKVRIGEFKN